MTGLALRVILSVLGAGVFYTLWLAFAIPGPPLRATPAGIAVLVLAPVAIAAGFAVGALLGERLTKRAGKGFLDAWIWALLGCGIGAFGVYPLGPMLIVFGMFGLGTLAMVLREISLLRMTPPLKGALRWPPAN